MTKQKQIATTKQTQIASIGFLRLTQIVGRPEVTEKQAAKNRKTGRGPRRPRAAIPAILPIGKSSFWQGIRDGKYPQPVKLGPGTTAWKVSDINALVSQFGRTP